MNKAFLVPLYVFGNLKINSLIAPIWVYDSKYFSDESILKDRTIYDEIKIRLLIFILKKIFHCFVKLGLNQEKSLD